MGLGHRRCGSGRGVFEGHGMEGLHGLLTGAWKSEAIAFWNLDYRKCRCVFSRANYGNCFFVVKGKQKETNQFWGPPKKRHTHREFGPSIRVDQFKETKRLKGRFALGK